MKGASKEIIKTLTDRGYRITKARTQVLEALVCAHAPLSIQAITAIVSVDSVSVYRTIAMLIRERLIEEINIQGAVALYEIAHGHHHHVVCTVCGVLIHLPCDSEQRIKKNIPDFAHIDSHEVTYYGVCIGCAQSSPQQ